MEKGCERATSAFIPRWSSTAPDQRDSSCGSPGKRAVIAPTCRSMRPERNNSVERQTTDDESRPPDSCAVTGPLLRFEAIRA